MIDFTIENQLSSKISKEKCIVLKSNQKSEKLFLLHMLYNTSKDSNEDEKGREDKYFDIRLTLTTFLLGIIIPLVPLMIIDPSNDTIRSVSLILGFTLITFNVLFDTWMKKANRIQGDLFFYTTSGIKDLFHKMNEKWYVFIKTPDFSLSQFPVHITTESDRKMAEKSIKQMKSEIKRKTKFIENKPSIKEIAKNKDNWIGKKIKLKCFLEWKEFRVFSKKSCYMHYILHDKSGSISAIEFFFKRHFWEKTPSIENIKNLKKGNYEITGWLTKQKSDLYHLTVNSSKLL